MNTKRYLSGIQPSGELHLGNYFGAMKQHLEHQDNAFYFIANYHALTSVQSAGQLRQATHAIAASYLACGLDPNRAVLFRQSDVPEVTELMWLLLSVASVGLLERGHAFKDKQANGIEPSGALLTYPVLMAADILAYDSDVVPVGQDQRQHIEMCRDMAASFNARFGSMVFKQPEIQLSAEAHVPGTNGQKMSKSYNNTIPLFATGRALRERIMSIKTDSMDVKDRKDPSACNVFALYSLLATQGERSEMAERYREGGYGYGHAKQALFEKIDVYFAECRDRYEMFCKRDSDVEDVLAEGGRKARAVAAEVTDRALSACGIRTSTSRSLHGFK